MLVPRPVTAKADAEVGLGCDEKPPFARILRRSRARGVRAAPRRRRSTGRAAASIAIGHRDYRGNGGDRDQGDDSQRYGRSSATARSPPSAPTAGPAGAEVIDASGRFVTPGIIDAIRTSLSTAVNEGGPTVTSMSRHRGRVQSRPTSASIASWRAALTVANLLHGSANPIGGQNAVIKLRWGKRAEELIFAGRPAGHQVRARRKPQASNSAAAGDPPALSADAHGRRVRHPRSVHARAGVPETGSEYEGAEATGEDHAAAAPRSAARSRWSRFSKASAWCTAHCYRADEILMLIRVADEFGFQDRDVSARARRLQGREEIAAHGAGASTFSDWWGYKIEAYDAIPYNAAIMTESGVVVSINSDSAEQARRSESGGGEGDQVGRR